MTQILAVAAYGDAVGAPYEFHGKANFDINDTPYLNSSGVFSRLQRIGEWTDDTYMALAIVEAWREASNSHEDFMNAIARQFVKWREENGTGIGIQTNKVLKKHSSETVTANDLKKFSIQQYHKNPDKSAGNGSLMRCHALACLPLHGEDLHRAVIDSTYLTHGDVRCVESALIWVELLREAAKHGGVSIEVALKAVSQDRRAYWRDVLIEALHTPSAVYSTQGWWVVPSMQQALSAVNNNIHRLESKPESVFREIIEAPKSDSDTISAIAGGLMGALGVELDQLSERNVQLIHGVWPRKISLTELAVEEQSLYL